jgi:TolB-like protein
MKTANWLIQSVLIVIFIIIIGDAYAQEMLLLDEGLSKLASEIGAKMELDNRMDVAVVDFLYLDGHMDNLCKYAAEEITTKLTQTKKFKIIERRLLEKVLAEQKIASNDMMNPESAKNLGKLLGVRALVTGSIADRGSSLRFNSRLLAADTGEVFDAVSMTVRKDEAAEQLMGVASPDSSSHSANRKTAAPIAFEDNFDDGLKDDWAPFFGEWRAVQRGLSVINLEENGDYRIMVGDSNWANYAIDVDTISADGSKFGVIFRASNNRNFYIAHFANYQNHMASNFSGFICKDGKMSEPIANAEIAIEDNKPQHIRIEIQSSLFVIFLNGKEISSFEDPTHTLGKAGLRIVGARDVRFDNFKITPLQKK